MRYQRSRTVLVGLGVAAGVIGAAALMSAATAPTARADDFTDIIAAVNGDLTLGQNDFTAAFTDFSSNQVPAGLTQLFDGVDEDSWATSTNLEVGTLDALAGEGITSSIGIGIPTPTDFADAVTIAQTEFASGETDFTAAVTALSAGHFADAAFDNAVGSLLAFDVPAQELFIGGLEALGL